MEKKVRLDMAKKKNNFSNINFFGQSDCPSPTSTLGLEINQIPTAKMFTADLDSGIIEDINIAFEQFQKRIIEIGNRYSGTKKKYFLKFLNQCSIDRFKNMSTEKGLLTIYGVREAEMML